MKKQLKTTLDTIKSAFGAKTFTANALHEALRTVEGGLSLSTLRWRLHSLKMVGETEVVARGVYVLSKHEKFEIKLRPGLYKISRELQKEFPHARFCVWSSDVLNQFTIHQPSISFNIVECERNVEEGVFSFLQNSHRNSFLNPNKKEVDHYLLTKNKSLVVKTLIQRAPMGTDFFGVNAVPKCEKILIDLIAEPDIFSIYQGAELKNIWREVCHKYSINFSSLSNYAKRRNVDKKVFDIMRELNLFTHNKENIHDLS